MSNNYYSEDFLDEWGMPTIKPFERGDNGILFWVELKLWEMTKRIVSLSATRGKFRQLEWAHNYRQDGRYIQAPWKPEDPSSHDNTTAIVAYQYLLKEEITVKIWREFWHPKDVGFYLWCKGGWRRWLAYLTGLWLFVFLAQASACNDTYKKRKHGIFVDTDGKLLTWVRCHCVMHESLLMRVGYKWYEKILKKHKEVWDYQTGTTVNVDTFERCFNFYFKDKEMPINKIISL